MPSEHREFGINEALDHVWSWRWTMVFFALLAFATGAYTYYDVVEAPPEQRIVLDPYAGLTPIGSTDELQHQLVAFLRARGMQPVVADGEVHVSSHETEGVESAVREFNAQLDSNVERLSVALSGMSQNAPGYSAIRMQLEQYRIGRESGLVVPVSVRFERSAETTMRPPVLLVKSIMLGALVLFVGLCLTFLVEILRAWWSSRPR